MNYIFPMAGYGKRCSELGQFKPFIQINGKEIFKHCVENLDVSIHDTVLCIISKETAPEETTNVLLDYFKSLNVKQVTVVALDNVPDGPALTVKEGVNIAVDELEHKFDGQIEIVNIDQIISYDSIRLNGNECAMPIYFNNLGSSCYVKLNKTHTEVVSIKEKDLISPLASSGAYLFGSLDLLLRCIEWGEKDAWSWVVAPKYDTEELFIGPCMMYAIRNGYKCYPVTTTSKVDLGSTNAINKVKDKVHEYSIW